MSRYFFNVHDDRSEHDTEGSELTSRDAARLMAVQLAGEILRDEARRQRFSDAWCVEVLDEAGGIVCSINVNISAPITSG